MRTRFLTEFGPPLKASFRQSFRQELTVHAILQLMTVCASCVGVVGLPHGIQSETVSNGILERPTARSISVASDKTGVGRRPPGLLVLEMPVIRRR